MAIFEICNIYQVNPSDNSLESRDTTTTVIPVEHDLSSADFNKPRQFTGLTRLDLAIFGNVIDENGVSSYDGLVMGSNTTTSLVIPSDVIEASPDLITPDLARKIATLHPDEVAQLGISKVTMSKIHSGYSKIKPLKS